MNRVILSIISLLITFGCSSDLRSNTPNNITKLLDTGTFRSIQWSPDGKTIAYIQDLSEIILMDVSTLKKKKLKINNDSVWQLTWVDQNNIVFNHSDSGENKLTTIKGSVSVYDLVSGKQSTVISDINALDNLSSYNNLIYLADNHNVMQIGPLNQSLNPTLLNIPNQEGKKFKISPKGGQIAFLDRPVEGKENLMGRNTLFLFSMKTNMSERVEKLKSYEIDGFAWSPTGDKVVIYGKTKHDEKPNVYITKLNDSDVPKILISSIGVADIAWSTQNNQIVLNKIGQPGKNELLLLNIPNEQGTN